MKWKTGLGTGKKKNNTKNKDGNGLLSSKHVSQKKLAAARPSEAPSSASAASTHNLGAVRVGIVRAEAAPICTPTPHAKRQLISELLEPDDKEEEDSEHTLSASLTLRNIISNKTSSGKIFDKEIGRGDSFSSYTPEEKVAFASHLNAHLLGDPFLEHLLPLDTGGADFFRKFNDGVLLCRLVCLAVPGSIADSKINLPGGSETLSLYKSTENLNAALAAAESAGLQVVNIGASDIIAGRPASILGLSWQLIRVHLLAQINLKRCPDLVHLMEEGEEKEAFFALPVEDVLLRWFNHHLRWGGNERRVSNFSDDLSDGSCYMTLMKELNDKFQEIEHPNEDPKRAQFRRACQVISGAEGIGISPFIRPRHIIGKAHLYNIAFVAQMLNRRPRIHRERLHLGAALRMQAWYRMLCVMHQTTPRIEERRESVTIIARAWRRRVVTKREQKAAVVILQARWRGLLGRRETIVRKKELSALKLQALWRGVRGRKGACERMMDVAAMKLQAWWRGEMGRSLATEAREKRQRVEEAIAAAKKAKLVKQAREAEAAAARAAQIAKAKADAARAEAESARAKAAAEKHAVETLAATRLQAWARVTNTRKAVSAARSARDRLLDSGDSSSHSIVKETQVIPLSPRTSVSSSVRWSEESPEKSRIIQLATSAISAPAQEPTSSSNWFNKVFSGISFGASTRAAQTSRADEAAAAMIVQRWRRRIVRERAERLEAMVAAERRRWAVKKLHKAYARKWRFELAVRVETRRRMALERERQEKEKKQKKKEEARLGSSGKSRWLAAIWGDLARGVAGTFEKENVHGEEDGEGGSGHEVTDCCDAKGQAILTSEVGWKTDYIAGLVVGHSGIGAAQEARARELSRRGTDATLWTPPENALSPAKCAIMMAALMAAVLETTVSSAAASGL